MRRATGASVSLYRFKDFLAENGSSQGQHLALTVLYVLSTKGPMWGYPRPVLGAVDPFLEPFRGRLSPNIDSVSEKLTLRYPHEGPWVDSLDGGEAPVVGCF